MMDDLAEIDTEISDESLCAARWMGTGERGMVEIVDEGGRLC